LWLDKLISTKFVRDCVIRVFLDAELALVASSLSRVRHRIRCRKKHFPQLNILVGDLKALRVHTERRNAIKNDKFDFFSSSQIPSLTVHCVHRSPQQKHSFGIN
jgi:gluconate kinase